MVVVGMVVVVVVVVVVEGTVYKPDSFFPHFMSIFST